MITHERWTSFEKRFQLLNIMAEFERARVAEEQGIRAHVVLALEKALELIDLTLDDPKWRNDLAMILGLRDKVARFYIGSDEGSVAILSRIL